MKYLCFGLLLFPLFTFGQKKFAPLGAEWIYDRYSFNCTFAYTKYQVNEEIEIDQKDCSIISAYYWKSDAEGWALTGDSLIVYEDSGRVYFQEGAAFYLMYDFTLESLDTLTYYDPIDRGYFTTQALPEVPGVPREIQILIESISTIEVNGQDFKVFNTLPLDEFSENCSRMNGVIENIGSNYFGLNGVYCITIAAGCFGDLECYRNENVNYSLTDESCDITIGTKSEINKADQIIVFPNPSFGEIEISHTLKQDPELIILYNHIGQEIYKANYSEKLDVANLAAGVYFISLKSGNKLLTKKIVVK